MNPARGMARAAVPIVLLVSLHPGRLQAQPSSSPPTAGPPESTGCRIVATVLGAGAGMFVGGLAGALIERALWEGEDAGLTGMAVGMVFGAMGGIQLARRQCEAPDEEALRRSLQRQVDELARSRAGSRPLHDAGPAVAGVGAVASPPLHPPSFQACPNPSIRQTRRCRRPMTRPAEGPRERAGPVPERVE